MKTTLENIYNDTTKRVRKVIIKELIDEAQDLIKTSCAITKPIYEHAIQYLKVMLDNCEDK